MKILFVLGFPNPFPGAAWTRIGLFAESWSKKGHLVDVLGTFTLNSLQKKGSMRIGNVNILNFVLNVEQPHPGAFSINSVFSFIGSLFLLFSRRPNIVVVSVPSGSVGLGAMMACRMANLKYVVDYRDQWEDYSISIAQNKREQLFYQFVKKVMRLFYSRTYLMTAVTPNMMEALKDRGLAVRDVIPNGADTEAFRPLFMKKSTSKFSIFYSGGIGMYYRLDIVLKSLKRLVENGFGNVKLTIVGSGEVQQLLSLGTQLGLSKNIEYKGVINEKHRLSLLTAQADVGIIPYDDNPLWKNSLPAKFFEYCACGIPVIATAYEDSLLAELIRKHEIGITTPPMNEQKLADAIYWMWQNRTFREGAGERARSLIEERFDRNKIAAEFLNLIKA